MHHFELDRYQPLRHFQEKGSSVEDPIVIDDEKITVHSDQSDDESTIWIADSSHEEDPSAWSDEECWVDSDDIDE